MNDQNWDRLFHFVELCDQALVAEQMDAAWREREARRQLAELEDVVAEGGRGCSRKQSRRR